MAWFVDVDACLMQCTEAYKWTPGFDCLLCAQQKALQCLPCVYCCTRVMELVHICPCLQKRTQTTFPMLDTTFDHKHLHDICILTSVSSQCCPHFQVRPLEMFFPFDPYLLRRSARFLKLPSSYNTWGGGHQHDTDASHLSSDDELEVLEGMQGLTPVCYCYCSCELHDFHMLHLHHHICMLPSSTSMPVYVAQQCLYA